MDIMTALAAASKAMEGLKLLREMEQSFDAASFKLKIVEVTTDVADLKLALIEAKGALTEKDEEVARLRKSFAFRTNHTVSVRGFTYEKGDDGNPIGMPYCPRCEAVDGRLIRLVETRTAKDGYAAVCPQCKTNCGIQSGFMYPEDTPTPIDRVPTIA